MNHHVVVEIKRSERHSTTPFHNPVIGKKYPAHNVVVSCWNILYKVPAEREDLGEEALSFKGCLAWIENNKVEGSKYAIVKMYLV